MSKAEKEAHNIIVQSDWGAKLILRISDCAQDAIELAREIAWKHGTFKDWEIAGCKLCARLEELQKIFTEGKEL